MPGLDQSSFHVIHMEELAPLKCKIFVWLAAQHRFGTSDHCARHRLQDQPPLCYTCLQEKDNVEHIPVQCVYAREVWHYCLDELWLNVQCPTTQDTLIPRWLHARTNFSKAKKRGFDSLVIATAWSLWKQKNARVFNRGHQIRTPVQLQN